MAALETAPKQEGFPLMKDGNEIVHHAHEIEKLSREGNYDDILSLLKDLEHARVTLLLQALVPEAVGGAECAPQHMALAHCIEEHIFTLHSANLPKYKACVRSKVSNLRNPKSPHLRQGLLSAQLGPEAFARMSTMEMADPELRALREVYTAWGIREHQRPLEVEGTPTDKIRCRRCDRFDCRVTQISRGTLFVPGWVHNRGSDVDMMTFVTCAVCGEKWYHSAWTCM
ncbi:hypothetical protein MATL_G00155230 [Megalops atlanticus]|uniref:TFIIS central domain-containing protein n=1 Tax=Megalops atlanticus TaxID=7932 RepID=A0A9D3PV36_MEGAT|nr:hypothetical protein MATL_G00155230 [Megalops atlanticus]